MNKLPKWIAGCDQARENAVVDATRVAVASTNEAVVAIIDATNVARAFTVSPGTTTSMLTTPSYTATPHSTALIDAAVIGTATPIVAELKAGEIDDNENWDDYLLYRQDAARKGILASPLDVSERIRIHVTDETQRNVLGARVRIFDGERLVSDTYTYPSGQTLFFPRTVVDLQVQTFNVIVEKGSQREQFTLERGAKDTWNITLRNIRNDAQQVKLDVLFLLDATGSMSDEIAQLQSNILSISAQIDALPEKPDVRYGLVTYRDRGEQYVTRIVQFTPDVAQFQQALSAVRADAGGDEPEALNAGLHDAIHGVEWRGDDTVKLIFLVADAPPHLDYVNDYSYTTEVVEAAMRGIKVYSLAASGLNDLGEYVLRQIAQYTMGHFIFLTYADPDANSSSQSPEVDESTPGDETNMSVDSDDYKVELLDKLVIRLIREELAELR
jgi:hypothetical protein